MISLPTWADDVPELQDESNICFFYEYMKGSDRQYSDPANQISFFIKNRWIELENDLARGYGDELTYLRGLAKCPYVVPENFWETQIKGLPYKQRASFFIKSFSSTCLCSW